MRYFKLPDLGEGLTEAEIVEWFIEPGDTVAVDQIILSVETDKAVVEIPAPEAGEVANLFAGPGEIVHIGEPLFEYKNGQDTSQTVVGKMSEGGEAAVAAPSAVQTSVDVEPQPATGYEVYRESSRVKTTPAIRSLAKRLGLDLEAIAATGTGGQITTEDLEQALELEKKAGKATPLKGVRRAMAVNIAKAHREVAQVTIQDEADISGWNDEQDITIRLILAIAAACKSEPIFNAWYDGNTTSIRYINNIDLGIAVDTKDGLFVPIMRDIGNADPTDLRPRLDRMRTDIERRTIPPAELRNPTITLSNFGTIAGKYASPMVVPPQVAIVGAGRIFDSPLPDKKSGFVFRKLLPISLSFDHRAITGGEAARFLRKLIGVLQHKDA